MTLADLLRASRRWWPIVLIGAIVTLGAAFLTTRAEPIYFARAEVAFLAPRSTFHPNELVTRDVSLIVTAGAVAKRINGAGLRLKFGDAEANIVGAPSDGENTWIKLLDTGTQWVPLFDHQVLVIDAKGNTREEVTERIDAAAALIEDELRELQSEYGPRPQDYITARLSPERPAVQEITGSAPRAAGMTVAIGGLLTIAVVVILEVRSRDGAGRGGSRGPRPRPHTAGSRPSVARERTPFTRRRSHDHISAP